ncbi:hypothetical protein DFH27DRAFT_604805 [Peziza echinospora]|nr:hypothetical protein DFH27DRAFT_604805 [Peziza echinospora]
MAVYHLHFTLLLPLALLFLALPSTYSKLLEYCSPPGPHIPYISSSTFSSPLLQEKLSELTTFLEEISSQAENPLLYDHGGAVVGGVNLAIAITTPTETVFTFNHGLRKSLEGKNPWTEHTVFRVASVSKAMTVWEVIKLGIGWEEKVVDYLPELLEGRYRKEWSEVTVGGLAGYVGGAVRDFEHDVSLRPQHVPKKLYRRDEEDADDGYEDEDHDDFYDEEEVEGRQGMHKRVRGGRDFYFLPEDIHENILDIDGYVESIWTSYLPDFHPSEAWKMGFPPLEEMEKNRCFYNCTRNDVLKSLADHPLIYPAFTTPAYSNVGFSLLGLVLERKAGISFDELMQRDMYGPLGMKDTFHRLPADAHLKREGFGANPFWGANDTWWETREIWGDWGVPAGGIFTSSHDLSIFLRTILAAFPYSTDPDSFPNKHSALPADKVREWLTPTAFTGGKSLLGRPWEIKRRTIHGAHGERPVTQYTKAGGGTGYNAGIILLPEYGIGVTILVAGDTGHFKLGGKRYHYHWATIARQILEEKGLIQAIEQAAYEEARRGYLGEYLFHSNILDGDDGANPPLEKTQIKKEVILSGMELVLDKGPGIRIKRWISNGTDFLETLGTVRIQMPIRRVPGAVAVARLYPVGNIRGRRGDQWAEDWRVWFEWEWENMSEEELKQNSRFPNPTTSTAQEPDFRSIPLYHRPHGRGKGRMPSSEERPFPEFDEPVPRRFWPDVLPGGRMKDTLIHDWAVHRSKPHVPEQEEDVDDHDQDEQDRQNDMEEYEEDKEQSSWWRKGMQKPKGSTATVVNSEEHARSWSNKQQKPPWWKPKYDHNEQLRGYADKMNADAEEEDEVEEDDGVDEGGQMNSLGSGKKNKFINYTFKKAEAHGSPEEMDYDSDDDEFDFDEVDYASWYMGSAGERFDMDYDTDDDEEDFYIPDHPPHSPPVPLYTRDNVHPYSYIDDDEPTSNDNGFIFSTSDSLKMQSQIEQQWDQWKDIGGGPKEMKKNKRWACADYNGIELQAWAGWSLGLVRFLREGPERNVVGIEVPALKVRLVKVGGGVVVQGGERYEKMKDAHGGGNLRTGRG